MPKSQQISGMRTPTLPPGVTPDQAGRAWAWRWLQGQANHIRREKRRKHRSRMYIENLMGRWLSICCPYRTNEHPGAEELLSMVTGLKESTAKVVMRRKEYPLSASNAEKLANYLERTYADVPALIIELREHARKKRL